MRVNKKYKPVIDAIKNLLKVVHKKRIKHNG